MSWNATTWGRQDRPAVVLLHGWLGQGADWLPVLEAWKPEYFCILPDLPGHGRHPLDPHIERYDFAAVATSLVQHLREDYGLERFHLGGYSMGGRLALWVAHLMPEVLESLVLESCQPGIDDPEQRKARALLDEQRAHQLLQLGLPRFLKSWVQARIFQSLHAHPELLERIQLLRSQNNPQGVAQLLRDLSPGRQPSLWGVLPSIEVPTLLLSGQLDEKYHGIMEQMDAALPRSQWHSLPGVGHNIHAEAPELWAARVQDFLRRR